MVHHLKKREKNDPSKSDEVKLLHFGRRSPLVPSYDHIYEMVRGTKKSVDIPQAWIVQRNSMENCIQFGLKIHFFNHLVCWYLWYTFNISSRKPQQTGKSAWKILWTYKPIKIVEHFYRVWFQSNWPIGSEKED
jgi:hypothetical protein